MRQGNLKGAQTLPKMRNRRKTVAQIDASSLAPSNTKMALIQNGGRRRNSQPIGFFKVPNGRRNSQPSIWHQKQQQSMALNSQQSIDSGTSSSGDAASVSSNTTTTIDTASLMDTTDAANSNGGDGVNVNQQRFKAVLFDMGGVLLKYKNPYAYEDLVRKARTNKMIAKSLQDFDLGLKSAEELRDLFADLMPNLPRCNIEEVAQVENTAILDEGLLAIVPQLREGGLKVGIVTNNGFWSSQRQRTVMLSDVSLFDLVFESCKLGLRKPSPQIFLKAAEQLGVLPTECIFIDDTEGHCRGAESVGMTAIHMAKCETAPVVKKLAKLLEMPLSTVKHRINLVDNGRRETFIWTYSPQFGWLKDDRGRRQSIQQGEEEDEEMFYW